MLHYYIFKLDFIESLSGDQSPYRGLGGKKGAARRTRIAPLNSSFEPLVSQVMFASTMISGGLFSKHWLNPCT